MPFPVPAPGHDRHRDTDRAETCPGVDHPGKDDPSDDRNDDSVDHHASQSGQRKVFRAVAAVAHQNERGQRPEHPHRDERDQEHQNLCGAWYSAP